MKPSLKLRLRLWALTYWPLWMEPACFRLKVIRHTPESAAYPTDWYVLNIIGRGKGQQRMLLGPLKMFTDFDHLARAGSAQAGATLSAFTPESPGPNGSLVSSTSPAKGQDETL